MNTRNNHRPPAPETGEDTASSCGRNTPAFNQHHPPELTPDARGNRTRKGSVIWRLLPIVLFFNGIAFAQTPAVGPVTYDSTVIHGQWAEITVRVQNQGSTSQDGGISVSFPSINESSDDVLVEDNGSSADSPGLLIRPAGSRIYNHECQAMDAQYLLAELADDDWRINEENYLRIRVKPKSVGSFYFYVRSAFALGNPEWCFYNNNPFFSDYTDQQSWPAFQYRIRVLARPDIICTAIDWPIPPRPDTVVEGQSSRIEATIKNSSDTPIGNTRAQLYLSRDTTLDGGDYFVDERDVDDLDEQQSRVISWDFVMPDLGSGTYTIHPICVVDSDDDYPEINEGNDYYRINPIPVRDRVAIPDLESVGGVAPRVGVGRPVSITVAARNRGAESQEGSIHVAVRHSAGNDRVDVSPFRDVEWAIGTKHFSPGKGAGEIYNRGNCSPRPEPAGDWFLEAWQNQWGENVSRSGTFSVTPLAPGNIRILVRTTMQTDSACTDWTNDISANEGNPVALDEQGWECRVYTVEVPPADPDLVSVSGIPAEILAGQGFTVTITAENDRGETPEGGIHAAVTHSVDNRQVAVGAPQNAEWSSGIPKHFAPGEGVNQIYNRGSCLPRSEPARDWLLEAWQNNWLSGTQRSMSFTVTPQSAGAVRIFVRTTMQLTRPLEGCADWVNDTSASLSNPVAIDEQGWGCREFTVLVRPAEPPVAVADGENSAMPGQRISFSGRKSYAAAAGAGIVRYSWDFGDGSTATGRDVSHSFDISLPQTTLFFVRLTVEDSNGSTDSDVILVTIAGYALGFAAPMSISPDPVNLATGNYIYDHVDIRVPGRGIPFEFRRFYNSRAADESGLPVGFGWTHSLNIRVTENDDRVYVHFGDGHSQFYSRESDGSYTPEVGTYDILTRDAEGRFAFSTKAQVQYLFGTHGRLSSISDRNGNAITLLYEGENLRQVEDTSGRLFVFTFDANDRIVRIEDPIGRIVEFTYDARGDLVRATDQGGGHTDYAYDEFHQMTSATDPRGNTFVQNAYDEFQRVVTTQSDAFGAMTGFGYDFETRTTRMTNALGGVSIHKHDQFLLVTNIIDEAGHSRSFAYDSARNLTNAVDRNGNVTRYEYDARGNVIKTVDPEGGETRIAYDQLNNPTERIDAAGHGTQFRYDGRGNLIATTNALRLVSAVTVDSFGLPLVIRNALGHSVTNVFEEHGNLVEIHDPFGNVTSQRFDAVGRKIEQVDANGHTNRFEFDSRDNVAHTVDGLGRTNQFFYDANGNRTGSLNARGYTITNIFDVKDRLVLTKDQFGIVISNVFDALDRRVSSFDGRTNRTDYGYDSLGRLLAVTNALQQVERTEFDPNGNPFQRADHSGTVSRGEFDLLNRLKKSIDELGNVTSYGFDALGRTIAVTNANQQVVSLRYDAVGSLTNVIDAAGHTVRQSFDEAGNRTVTVDPLGQVSRVEYDELKRPTGLTDAGGNRTEQEYDAVGNVIERRKPNGAKVFYDYDAVDQVTNIVYGTGESVQFFYDESGNRVRMFDSLGSTHWEYDLRNRLIRVTDPFGMSVRYRYDEADNPTMMEYPGGKELRYEYDPLNRLVKMTDWLGGETRYEYDNVGNLILVQHPNGLKAHYGFDAAGRIVALTNILGNGNILSRYALALDGLANIQEAVIEQPLAPILKSQTARYSYGLDNRITSIDGSNVLHDPSGNLTGIGADTFDSEDRLTASSWGGVMCSYDGLGHRLARTINGVTRRFVLDHATPLAQVLVETDGSGAIIAYYAYGRGLSARITADGQAGYYAFDPRGNTLALVNSNGEITDSYAYNTFGEVVNRSGTTPNPFSFLGRFGLVDDGNGLLYARMRFYSPWLGRFITKDPLTGVASDSQSLHRYVYALNNPMRFLDYSGLSPLEMSGASGLDYHLLLDACGFIPGYGEFCDVGNALFYAFEGDWGNAGISLLAVVPVIGDVGKTGRIAGKGIKAGEKFLKDTKLVRAFDEGTPRASDIEAWALAQGWVRSKKPTGPVKYLDEKGIARVTLKKGSSRTPGSDNPHVEFKDIKGQRVDPFGNPVTRRSIGNHAPIIWDLD